MATTTARARTSSAAGATAGARIARNFAVLAGSQFVTWTLTLVWTIFVPRALHPEGIGELTAAQAVTGMVFVLAGLGVGTLLVKDIAREHDRAPSLIGSAILVRAGFVLPSLAIIAVFLWISRFGPEQTLVIWLATGTMVFGMFIQVFQSAFQGIERMEYIAYSDMLSKAVASIAAIAMVIIGFRVVGLMKMSLIITAAALLLLVWWSRGKFSINWKPDPTLIRHVVVASLPYWTTGMVLTFYMWIDSVMLSVMTSSTVVGWYGVPTRIFNSVLFLPVILGTAMLPRLSAAFRESPAAMANVGKPALELIIVLSLPVAVGSTMIAQPFITDLYGPLFAPATRVLMILGLTVPPTYFNILANQVLVASNRQVAWTKVMVAAAVINPLLNLVLIRYCQEHFQNGAIGAALSLMTTELGMAAAGLYLLPRMLNFSSILRFLRALCATGGMALAVWVSSSYGLIIELGTGAAVFAVLILVLRVLNRDEVTLLKKILAKVLGRDEGRYSTTRYHGWDDISARPSRTLGR
jgi:O-antigen/teichoic acid export membrane protein